MLKVMRTHDLDGIAKKEKSHYIIKFGSKTCGPCKVMEPVLKSFADHNPNINVYLVDTDESPELASHFQIKSIPTIHFCKKREIVFSLQGVTPENQLQYFFDHLNDPHFLEHGEMPMPKKKHPYLYYGITAGIILLFAVLIFSVKVNT